MLARCRFAARVQIDPDEINGKAPLRSPALDPAQHVAVAEADIQDAQPGSAAGGTPKKSESRPRCECHGVYARKIGNDRGIDGGIEIVGVH